MGINYDYKCQECGGESVHNVSYSKRDLPHPCFKCGGLSVRFYKKMPGLTKASFVDGTKRKGWADLKATAKLEEARAQAGFGSDDREQISKELNEREAQGNSKKT